MEARDKNYNLIELGTYVELPNPKSEFDDCWSNSFVGSVLKIGEGNYLTVEDAEGDCFTIECERVEITN